MPKTRNSLSAAVGAALVLGSACAQAYCRTAVCQVGNGATASYHSGQECLPAQANDCGTPLRWAQGCFGFSMNQQASKRVDLAVATQLMQSAFASWQDAACGGGRKPGFSVADLGPVACHEKQYNQEAGNANIVMFDDDVWPYGDASYAASGNTLALTTVTYSLDDGSIYDADLEINGTVDLTTGDGAVQYDLLSIMTHEAGHMLGLAHSADEAATMFIQYTPGTVSLRHPNADDQAAICAAYPPPLQPACDPTPRHGFASQCDDGSGASGHSGGCELAPASPGASDERPSERPIAWLSLVPLALALGLRRLRANR